MLLRIFKKKTAEIRAGGAKLPQVLCTTWVPTPMTPKLLPTVLKFFFTFEECPVHEDTLHGA